MIQKRTGVLKIADFGTSNFNDTSSAIMISGKSTYKTSSVAGTPGFMAPEQAEVDKLTERTDVYNFGATMYWMLTGQEIPTAGPGSRTGKAVVPPLATKFNNEIPVELSEVVNLCLEPNPHGRWKNMHAVVRQIDKIREGMSVQGRTM